MCKVAILLCASRWLVVSKAKQLSILSAMVLADGLLHIQPFLFAFALAFATALAPRHLVGSGARRGTAIGGGKRQRSDEMHNVDLRCHASRRQGAVQVCNTSITHQTISMLPYFTFILQDQAPSRLRPSGERMPAILSPKMWSDNFLKPSKHRDGNQDREECLVRSISHAKPMRRCRMRSSSGLAGGVVIVFPGLMRKKVDAGSITVS